MHVQVRVKGAIGPTIASAFDEMTVRTESVMAGDLIDDAALHGLLDRLRDLGLQVIDVHVSSADSTGPAA